MDTNFTQFEESTAVALKHDKKTYLYALSRFFERAGFYGLRAILILYLIGETHQMTDIEAISLYSLFGAAILFGPIVGALLGDLLIGNKKSLIIGGFLQALGAFALCIPSITGLYTGLILICIGGGLYAPNFLSHYGKLYLAKTKLLDAAFTLLYVFVNIGATITVLLIGYISQKYSFTIGFMLAGLFFIIATALPLLLKESKILVVTTTKISFNLKLTAIAIAFVLTATYWSIYETIGLAFYDLQTKIMEVSTLAIPDGMWSSLTTTIVIPLAFLLAIIWSYVYYNQFVKLTTGFVLATISVVMLYYIPEVPQESHVASYYIAILLLAISEIHIAPIIRSVLTQYSNPKYLAILMSVASVLFRLVYVMIGYLFNDTFYDNNALALKFGFIVFGATSIGLVIFLATSLKLFKK